jgi:hypothetical protein
MLQSTLFIRQTLYENKQVAAEGWKRQTVTINRLVCFINTKWKYIFII